MAGEWQEVTIGKFAPFVYGKGLPEQTRNPNGAFPVFGSNGIVGWHDKPLTEGPTLIIGRKGTVGAVHFSLLPCWPIDTTFYITGYDFTLIRYRYYLLKSLGLEHMNSDSAVPGLNRDAAHARIVCIPKDESEQKAIAHILGTLDDKLELNRRMNKTMEEMARAIFKSWFVDFDPLHAKAAVRRDHPNWTNAQVSRAALPNLSPEIAELFPDALEDSDLGEIPKGWNILPLSDVCKRITDGSHFSPKSVDVGRPMASVKDMRDWGFELSDCRRISEDNYQELVRNDCRPLAGDVLIAKDGSYLKHIFVVEDDLDLVILSSIAILRPNEKLDSHLLAFSLKGDETMIRMKQYVSGAVLQRIVLKDFRTFPLLVPSREVQQTWTRMVNPFIKRCWRNINENEALCAIRDTLLPKLISGELRIKNAEQILQRSL